MIKDLLFTYLLGTLFLPLSVTKLLIGLDLLDFMNSHVHSFTVDQIKWNYKSYILNAKNHKCIWEPDIKPTENG